MRNPTNEQHSTRSRRPLLGTALLAALVTACGGGGGSSSSGGSVGKVGTTAENPATGLNFVVDTNEGGNASSLRIVGMFWGRLVDVQDSTGTALFTEYVVGENIKSDGVDYQLDRNPVTAVETLTILHPRGTPAFEAAFSRLESNLTDVLDKGLGANVLPPYTMVKRNSALVLRFNDLLKDGGNPGDPTYPGTVNPRTIEVLEGYPPVGPYELRILPDPSHGDLVGGQFHSTRVIMDMTVSPLEGQAANVPVNSLGLPAAVVASLPNLAVRIPTQLNPNAAQFELLESLSGARVSFNGNGSNDPSSPTLDVVRAARSGSSLLNDPDNGFLVDDILPEILGAQPVSVSLTTVTGPNEFLADITFGTKQCASKPKIGDVIELPSHTLLVSAPGKSPLNGLVPDVQVQVLTGDLASFTPPLTAVGQYRTTWDPNGAAAPECFVRYSPTAASPPNVGIAVQADVLISFSEPMDPASVLAFQSFELEYGVSPNPANPIYRRVVGNVLPSADLGDFTFEPSFPLKHHADANLPAEQYLFSVSSGPMGVSDLAGNSLANALPQVSFTIDPTQPKVDSGGIALDFSSQNEDGDPNNWPEIRGQFLQDVGAGVINSRAVTHFSAAVDPTQSIVGSMIPINNPIQTPLSNLGSKMHGVWRYVDMGFALLDDTNHNLDVEGLWWEPFDGTPQFDIFPRFEIRLGHCFYFPDEDINNGLLPKWENSGLANKFDNNYADPVEDPPTIVSPQSDGYLIEPFNTVSDTGREIAAWPMNRNKAPEDYTYWTWRDTSKLMVGGPDGVGVDPSRSTAILGANASLQGFYKKNLVPSIGMPLLMEFRTSADTASTGQNGFKIAIAINSSAQPYFRTYSTGGILNSGQSVIVDPDQQPTGKGGVNPNNGQKTQPRDNAFYYGQADFVVRVSRFHTIWLDTLAAGSSFAPPVLEPSSAVFPTGTQVVLAFRGAEDFNNTGTATDPWTNAAYLDPYGDPYDDKQWEKLTEPDEDYSFRVVEWPVFNDTSWVSDPSMLLGARYIQARATMIANPLSGLAPYVSAIGVSYLR